jgi:hypothetical protein
MNSIQVTVDEVNGGEARVANRVLDPIVSDTAESGRLHRT